jgi:hypothetical protein
MSVDATPVAAALFTDPGVIDWHVPEEMALVASAIVPKNTLCMHDDPASIVFPALSNFTQSFVVVVPVECCTDVPVP